MAVDAVLRPLEADVVTTRTKQGMERWLCEWAMVNRLGSSLIQIISSVCSQSGQCYKKCAYCQLNQFDYQNGL